MGNDQSGNTPALNGKASRSGSSRTLKFSTSHSNTRSHDYPDHNDLDPYRAYPVTETVPTPVYTAFPSTEMIDVVWIFWKDSVDILPRKKQLEVAVLLYTNMFATIPSARRLFLRNDLKSQALKYLDMLGWLIRRIKTGDQDSLHLSVQRLGQRHASWGVELAYFLPMMLALHSALASSFPQTYTVRIKYSMEKVFWSAAQIMTSDTSGLNDANSRILELEALQSMDSLDICLSSAIGVEYLTRFLEHSYRAELMDFLVSLKQFRGSINAFERDQVAQRMVDSFLSPRGSKFLGDCPGELMDGVRQSLNRSSRRGTSVSAELFDSIHQWVMEEISQQSWPVFMGIIRSLADDMPQYSN